MGPNDPIVTGFILYFSIFRKVVVLNSYEAMREAFVQKGQIFGGRPYDPRDKYVNPSHPKVLGNLLQLVKISSDTNVAKFFHF